MSSFSLFAALVLSVALFSVGLANSRLRRQGYAYECPEGYNMVPAFDACWNGRKCTGNAVCFNDQCCLPEGTDYELPEMMEWDSQEEVAAQAPAGDRVCYHGDFQGECINGSCNDGYECLRKSLNSNDNVCCRLPQ